MRGALKGQAITAPEPPAAAATGSGYDVPPSSKYSQGVMAVYEACRRAPYRQHAYLHCVMYCVWYRLG